MLKTLKKEALLSLIWAPRLMFYWGYQLKIVLIETNPDFENRNRKNFNITNL